MNRTLNFYISNKSDLISNTWNPTSYNNAYLNAFEYDAMGNILTQQRHKRDGTKIEEMSYQYQYANGKLQRNRLYHINDGVASNMDATDIDDMGAFDPTVSAINQNNNYSYDEEGRLVKDVSEQISKITWRVDGKVKEIQRGADTSKRFIRFDYDAMGHRIAKHVYDNTGIVLKKSTYYILDAQGNQIAMYEHLTAAQTVQYNLIEKNIFGSARLGTKEEKTNMLTAAVSPFKYTRTLGWKKYEFSNHLGNVLAVFCDVKVPLDNNTDGTVDAYRVCMQSASDYSPFGVLLDGRSMQKMGYRYGFGGMENDDEVKGEGNSSTTEYRQLDTRLGRWLSIDPLTKSFSYLSPFNAFNNNPIRLGDITGMAPDDFVKRKDGSIYWDKKAISKKTTKAGETYLGKTLTFKFNSYIDGNLWDGPLLGFPAGDKLTSNIHVTANTSGDNSLLSINVNSDNPIIHKTGGLFQGDGFFPGETNFSVNTSKMKSGFQISYEQHAKVNGFEEFGLNSMNYDIVNVAQKLTIQLSSNNLIVKAYTDIFPSAALSVNGNMLFKYDQPSFQKTHGIDKVLEGYRVPMNKLDDGLIPIYSYVHRRPAPSFYLRYNK